VEWRHYSGSIARLSRKGAKSLVEIEDLVDERSWPLSDTVFVLTSMEADALRKLVAKLKPDEVGQFPSGTTPSDLPPLRPGMKILGVWWD